jgi:hypothetical protein
MEEELRAQTLDVLSTLSEEQVQLVLAYAKCLKDSEGALVINLEELLDKPL